MPNAKEQTPADRRHEPGPIRDERQHPEERRSVDGDRDRELQRLHPRGGAGDDPWIDDEPQERDGSQDKHREHERDERRIAAPDFAAELASRCEW